jgi:hypothetical protein
VTMWPLFAMPMRLPNGKIWRAGSTCSRSKGCSSNSVGVTYRRRALADPGRNYGTAFSNMHRELYQIYVDGNVVVVQLALQGRHDGPLQLPFGKLPPTGKQMDAALGR